MPLSHFTLSTNESLPKITIVGAAGFIGSNLSNFFKNLGYEVVEIYKSYQILPKKNYGVVLYCAGVTAGFRERPFDVINAHITNLVNWLTLANFDKLIYFSSARIYMGNKLGLEGVEDFIINRNDTYNQSKILGESICQFSKKNTAILRLSHVIGYDPGSPYFFWNVIRQFCSNSPNVSIDESPQSKRDYIFLEDLFCVIKKIIKLDKTGVYNVSSGIDIKNIELVSIINEIIGPKEVFFGKNESNFPSIENKKIVQELGVSVLDPKKVITMMCEKYIERNVSIL